MPLDVGIGILLGLIFAPLDTNTALNVTTGIIFALLPDADVLIYYGSKFTGMGKLDKKVSDHRDLFHYPLIYIAIGLILLIVIKTNLVQIFVIGGLFHFLHDSVGTGWGIPWFYPLSNKRLKFFYQYDLHKAGQPHKLVWAWSKAEQNQLIKNYGDKDWHKHTFQIWKYATVWQISEIIVFVIAIIVLIVR